MAGTALYAAVGPRLTRYDLDPAGATLVARESVELPAGVQYAWRHATKPFLYVACSDGGLGETGTTHCACALRIGADGALAFHGAPVPLPIRPVHLSTDRDSRHALLVTNAPSTLTVLRIREDGTLGERVSQEPAPLGANAHQVMVTPSNDRVVVPVRGTDAKPGAAEEPGSLVVFDYRDGLLERRQTIAPNGGFGFGPRHVDFHPSRPWMYMSIERQHEIALFRLGAFVEGPDFRKTALMRPGDVKPRQLVGAIHVHPSGRYVYVSNRADGMVDFRGRKVFNGGENTIAVYAIDPASGEPTLLQAEDTRGIHVRTFHVHPDGRVLVAANMRTRLVREGDALRSVPGGLSVFRIGEDGRLAFVRKYDVDVSAANLFWMGMVSLPAD